MLNTIHLRQLIKDGACKFPGWQSPTATTSEFAPTIEWQSSFEAAAYDVWISNLSTNTSPVRRETVTGTSYVPDPSLGIGLYRVWVRSLDAAGNPTAWSVPRTFQINPRAVLHAMEKFQATSRPTISLDGIPGL